MYQSGNELDTSSSSADETDSFSGEVQVLLRPRGRYIRFSFELLGAHERNAATNRQDTNRRNEKSRREGLARDGSDPPELLMLTIAPLGGFYPSVELNMFAYIESICNMFQVVQHLCLARVTFFPGPIIVQFIGDVQDVGPALTVGSGSRAVSTE